MDHAVAVLERDDRASRALIAAAMALAIIAVGLSALRVVYGVSLTDEAFYAAVPYRFAQGDIPFVDENNVGQTAGILTAPLVYAWISIVGSTGGLILFLRAAYLVLMVGTGLALYLLLRRTTSRHVALLAALAAASMAPFRLPTLSYNTLSMALVALGCIGILLAQTGSRRAVAAGAGAAHVLACFAYPPLALALAGGVLFVLCSKARRSLPWVGWYAVGAAVAGVPLAVLLMVWGLPAMLESLRVTRSMGSQLGGISKPFRVVWGLMRGIAMRPLLPAAVVTAMLVVRRRPVLAAGLLAVTPLLGVFPTLEPVVWNSMSLVYVASYPLVCIWPVLTLSTDTSRTELLRGLAVATVALGMVFGYASSNSYMASGLAYPLLFAFVLVGVSALVDELLRRGGWTAARAGIVAVVPPALALIVMVGMQFSGSYMDAPIPELTERVAAGPYTGLRTTPDRVRMLEELTTIIEERVPASGSVFFYPKFPAGYLLSARRALTNFVWAPSITQRPSFDFASTTRYFDRRGALPDLVVYVPLQPGDTPDGEPYAAYFAREGYEPVAVTAQYRAWVRPGLSR
jgi:hypothetical protein